ncbi:hypothetical protein [Luteolibacter sp. AS25]|uniref:hypothetical protein n=1 Tax=Luteolibacter sp. AS25 TaxID=3135776 RepID=UPI00398A9FA6
MADSPSTTETTRFVCEGCGTALIVQGSNAGLSGPCPKCNMWIDSSAFREVPSGYMALNANIPSQRRKTSDKPIRKGRLSADGFLDHDYNEKRELHGTLKILAITLAVVAVILFVTVYMNQWMAK